MLAMRVLRITSVCRLCQDMLRVVYTTAVFAEACYKYNYRSENIFVKLLSECMEI